MIIILAILSTLSIWDLGKTNDMIPNLLFYAEIPA